MIVCWCPRCYVSIAALYIEAIVVAICAPLLLRPALASLNPSGARKGLRRGELSLARWPRPCPGAGNFQHPAGKWHQLFDVFRVRGLLLEEVVNQ